MKAIPKLWNFVLGLKAIISLVFPVRVSASTFTFHFKTLSQTPDDIQDMRDIKVDKYKVKFNLLNFRQAP